MSLIPDLSLGIDATAAAASMAGVTQDATSLIYCPANAAEWTITMAAAGIGSGGPSLLWKCDEASGNLADSIGAFTGTASGTGLGYQAAVTGWARKAVTLTDATSGIWSNAAGGLPSLATQSQLMLIYSAVLATPAAERTYGSFGNVNANLEVTSANKPLFRTTGQASVAGTALGTTVHPVVLKWDFTNSANKGYTDVDALAFTFGTSTGQGFRLGAGGGVLPGNMQFLYAVSFFLGAAELTDAQIRTLLQKLGWAVSW